MAEKLQLKIIRSLLRMHRKFKAVDEPFDKGAVRNILLINTTALGDTLMSTPAIRALRKGFPGARMTALAGSSAELVLRGSPAIDTVLNYPDKINLGYLLRLPGFISGLRARRFDLAVVLHGNDPDAVPIAYLSGARWRLGLSGTTMAFLLTWHEPMRHDMHLVESRLDGLSVLGVSGDGNSLEIHLSREEEAAADEFLKEAGATGKKIACIHSFARKSIREWPRDRVAELGDRLSQEEGFTVVILGGSSDKEAAEAIAALMSTTPITTAGKTNLRVSAAVIKRSSLLVATDSGVMHIGQALKVPTVALFGAGEDLYTGPVEKNSVVVKHPESCSAPRACKKYNCDDIVCMKSITVDEVMDGAKRICRL